MDLKDVKGGMDYADMSLEELEVVNRVLMAEKEEIRKHQKEINRHVTRLVREHEGAKAKARVASMLSDGDQVLSTKGIKSQEKVGGA